MAERKTETPTVVTSKPTADMPEGLYKVIANGLYWGTWRVSVMWTGQRVVIEWEY